MPFYKIDGQELLCAPSFVMAPGYELHAETQAQHTYPVDGWYWFDTLDAAMSALRPPAVEVSRFQARAALHMAGLLTQIEALMADPATPVLTRLAWQDAQVFRRDSPTVAAMSAALGLSSAQVDDLFATASQITA